MVDNRLRVLLLLLRHVLLFAATMSRFRSREVSDISSAGRCGQTVVSGAVGDNWY